MKILDLAFNNIKPKEKSLSLIDNLLHEHVDNLLHEHVELPHGLDLAVHLVQLTTCMGRGGHTETFFFSEVFP